MAVISNTTTIIDAGAISPATAGSMNLIKSITASSSATITFTHGDDGVIFDDTYDVYVFKFINLHPQNANIDFHFQVDTGTNTAFNQPIVSAATIPYHNEADNASGLDYGTDMSQVGTAFQGLLDNASPTGNDSNGGGSLTFYSPSSDTFVKLFAAKMFGQGAGDFFAGYNTSGYVNTATALTKVRFKYAGGNIDSGEIKLYGVKG